jgi:DedD protein
MQVKTKYRILGVVVMVAVAAIVLPRLWEDSTGIPNMKLSFAIPKQATPAASIELPKQPVAPAVNKTDFTVVGQANDTDKSSSAHATATAPVGQDSKHSVTPHTKTVAAKTAATTSTAITTSTTAATTPAAKPQPAAHLFAQTVPDAWVIQLGTFSNANNVAQLIAKLRKDGLAAYQRTTKSGSRNLIQVFVGPEIEKTKLQPLLDELHNKFNLRGVVRRYKV